MPISIAPYRQDKKVFVTPLVADILFYETRDCTRSEFPEYGTPHPNSSKWPNHKLVFIQEETDTDRDGIFRFYYAADRENQDLYNFSFETRNIAGREFRMVTRTYLTPRADYTPLDIPFGTAMPDVPSGKFDGVEYVYYDREQQRTQEKELDSLYVVEAHAYVEKAVLDEVLSKGVERPILVPEKFRALLPTVVTETLASGEVQTPTLDTDDIAVTEEQRTADLKQVRTISRSPNTSTVSLTGGRAYAEGTAAQVTETYSPTQIDPETGLLVVESTTSPLGDGSFVRETVKVTSWPVLTSSEWNPEFNAQVIRTEQFVNPPTDFTEPNTSFRAVNEDRALKIVEQEPSTALNAYVTSFPIEVTLQLPNVLRSIKVTWASESGAGSFDSEWNGYASGISWSLGGQESGDSDASASVKPELIVDTYQPWGADLPATAYFFYAKTTDGNLTESAFMNRLVSVVGEDVLRWPVFKPAEHTLVLKGMQVRVSARAQGGASKSYSITSESVDRSEGSGTSSVVGLSVNAVNLGPTIHDTINLSGDATKSVSCTAKANASWSGSNFPSVNAGASKTGVAYGSVTPTTLPATSPAKIPDSGKYLVQSRVEPYKWGWLKCYAVVFDASVLA